MADDLPEMSFADAAGWWAWLGAAGQSATGVWPVLAKQGTTDPTSLTYDQVLGQALCDGWIGGQVRRRDAATSLHRFTPRRKRSQWSARIVTRLLAEARMRPADLAEVERSQVDGRWRAADAGQASVGVPAELGSALAADPAARAMFDLHTSQNRYAARDHIESVERPETRARRIAGFVAMLGRGETVHPQRRTRDGRPRRVRAPAAARRRGRADGR